MKKIALILLIILGLLPIIRLSEEGPSSILIFSLFVLVFLWKGLRKAAAKIAIPLGPYYIVLGTILGGLTQAVVQIEGFEKFFSSDPLAHFLQALTIYFCVTIVWYFILKKYELLSGKFFG